MRPRPYLYFLLFVLSLVSAKTFSQTIEKKQRVTGIINSSYDSNGEIMEQDSIEIFYSESRGSRFMPFNFIAPSSYYYNGYNLQYNPGQMRIPGLPDILDNSGEMTVLYDSARVYGRDWSRPRFRLLDKYYAWYNDTIITQHDADVSYGRLRYDIIYKDETLPKTYTLLKYDTAKKNWDTLNLRWLSYDKDNKAVRDTVIVTKSNDTWAAEYVYDQAGRISQMTGYNKAGTSWEKIQLEAFAYDTDGNLIRYANVYLPGQPGEDTMDICRYQYDATQRITIYTQYNKHEQPANKSREYEYYYNANSLIDTLKMHDNSNGVSYSTHTTFFYYNSYGNPDSAYSYIDINQIPKTFRNIYRYETYKVKTDTPIVVNTLPLIIFPNPAKNSFKIRWNSKYPSVPVYLCIHNSGGQLVRRIYIAKASPETLVNTGGLASGVYHLSVITASGGMLHTESLVINQ